MFTESKRIVFSCLFFRVLFFLGLFTTWHKITLDIMNNLGNYYPVHSIKEKILRLSH